MEKQQVNATSSLLIEVIDKHEPAMQGNCSTICY